MAENPQIIPFFTRPEVATAIEKARTELRMTAAQSHVVNCQKAIVIAILSQILDKPELWDKNCQYYISQVSSGKFIKDLGAGQEPSIEFAGIFSHCLCFLLECSLHDRYVVGQVSARTNPTVDVMPFVLDNLDNFSNSDSLKQAVQLTPMWVLRFMLHQGEFGEIRKFYQAVRGHNSKIAQFQTELEAKGKEVETLKSHLDKVRDGYNFVGLHEGFNSLAKQKQSELRSGRSLLCAFGALAMVPLIVKAAYFIWWKPDFEIDGMFVTITVTALALTGILLYFFKVALAKCSAAKAQLLQIELRMTLCRFIERYVEYAKDVHSSKQSAHILDKFENVIFSGIVSNDEQMPAVFDGAGQLAKLLGAIKRQGD